MKSLNKIFSNYVENQRHLSILPYSKGRLYSIIILLLVLSNRALAQDPTLPPTNLGMLNVFDGMGGKPGLVYQGYAQVFQTQKVIGARGQDLHSDLKVNSLVQISQFIYQTPVKVFGGEINSIIIPASSGKKIRPGPFTMVTTPSIMPFVPI